MKEMEQLLQVTVSSGSDVVLARQRAQSLALLAGFPVNKQTSFATALSEISRNALTFAGEAKVQFSVRRIDERNYLAACVRDNGPGIRQIKEFGAKWETHVAFQGQGIASARRLVKYFSIECGSSGGTCVTLGIPFPEDAQLTPKEIAGWVEQLVAQKPRNLLEEADCRNQELLHALQELQEKDARLNVQLAETNRLNQELATNQEQLENRVAERTAKLQESVDELIAFSYAVSHDLRAPLRAINGFTSTLMEEHVHNPSKEAQELAQRIDQATERMDSLIGDLVTYAQVTRAKLPLFPLNPQEVVDEVRDLYGTRSVPCEFTIQREGAFPTILANGPILQTCLTNLVDNALKYCKKGEAANISLTGKILGTLWEIRVIDSGIGIDPAHHARIFQVFQRLHGHEYPGTGIGLALVKRWVERMGGAVGVDSQLGKGAEFWIHLPLAP
jgi:signal transduction histidine kinase